MTDEIRALEQELRSYVQTLAGQIGERNFFRYEKLVKAAEFIRTALADAGYKVRRQTYLIAGQSLHPLGKAVDTHVPGVKRPGDGKSHLG